MTVYRLGSRGPEITAIQTGLKNEGFYLGPLDGDFGGGTQAAVSAFQHSKNIDPDGCVGSITWNALLGGEIPAPAGLDADLPRRCLALTGAFETGVGFPDCFCGISGDFDGQGISFGVLQWNFGQRSLQPLLLEMFDEQPQISASLFGAHLDALRAALSSSQEELMAFSRSVQHPVTHAVFEPWKGLSKALGRTPEFQAIQARHASAKFDQAVDLCNDFGLRSERAAALMFDIVVQNGSINTVVRAQIQADLRQLASGLVDDDREVATMEIVANRRAQAANPRWVDDVRSRKLCIARGAGVVHGMTYELQSQFGLGLQPFIA